jgi:hypothetical protein
MKARFMPPEQIDDPVIRSIRGRARELDSAVGPTSLRDPRTRRCSHMGETRRRPLDLRLAAVHPRKADTGYFARFEDQLRACRWTPAVTRATVGALDVLRRVS